MVVKSGSPRRRFLFPSLIVHLLLLVGTVGVSAGTETDAPESSPSKCTPVLQDKAQPPGARNRQAITLSALPRNILKDQKFLWVQPFRWKGVGLRGRAAMVGITAGLVAIDRPVGQEISDGPPGGGYTFGKRVERWGGGPTNYGVATAFYFIGRWRGNERARITGLLGLQAVTDSLIVVEILKTGSRRPRPTLPGGFEQNHNADGEFFTGGRSFPSGHSAEAWALATIIAHQYQHRRWVPPTAYCLAGLVAVSRASARRHFPSDIFVGSVLGYLIGRHVAHAGCEPPNHTPHRWRLVPYGSQDGGVGLRLSWQF